MLFKQAHRLLSFRRLLLLIAGMAVIIQLMVITYNHLSGYYVLEGSWHFAQRLLRGTLLSVLAGFLIAYPDLWIIRQLNSMAPWGKKVVKRLLLQFLSAITIAILVSTLITLFANWLSPYTEDFTGVLISNALIYSVTNIIMMAVLEGWIFYYDSRQSRQMADSLREELSQIRFEVLKSQINPHFMFNSLNVLSGLIGKEPRKAQQFVDEFAHIYRYVLETIEQPVTTLEQELDFMRSYLFLQQIRYGGSLTWEVTVSSHLLPLVLPPLSLQVVLENAIKHNIVNPDKPLLLEICSEGQTLVVRNNLQPKISRGVSTGLGLKNLEKRYALISPHEPVFQVQTHHYVARLPLINPDTP